MLLAEGHIRQPQSRTCLDRRTPAQVRQGKRRLAVAAVGGAQNVKQRLVLGDGKQLTVAEGPTVRREIAPKKEHFTQVRFILDSAAVLRREDALLRDDIAQREGRLANVYWLTAADRKGVVQDGAVLKVLQGRPE